MNLKVGVILGPAQGQQATIYRDKVYKQLDDEIGLLAELNRRFPSFEWEYDDGGADAGFLQFVASTSTGVYPYLLAIFE